MDITNLKSIVLLEYGEIVAKVLINDFNELRIILKEESFIDIWFSPRKVLRYSYHWERKNIDGTIYRHDNVSHKAWQDIKTFPKHFHNGSGTNVEESYLSDDPEEAVREFLNFIREKLKS